MGRSLEGFVRGKGTGNYFTMSRFPLTTTQPEAEAIRISWLVRMYCDIPPDYISCLNQYGGGTYYPKRESNHLATEKRQAYIAPIDPNDDTNENNYKTIASLIGRYKRRAKRTTENVWEEIFP